MHCYLNSHHISIKNNWITFLKIKYLKTPLVYHTLKLQELVIPESAQEFTFLTCVVCSWGFEALKNLIVFEAQRIFDSLGSQKKSA